MEQAIKILEVYLDEIIKCPKFCHDDWDMDSAKEFAIEEAIDRLKQAMKEVS